MTTTTGANGGSGKAAKDRKVRNIVLIVGGLIIFGFIYGSGMSGEIHIARKIDERRKVAEQGYRDAQRKLRARLAALQQLEARRQIALALTELDRRNFGTAQERVNDAVKLLDQAQAGGTSNPDMAAPLEALRKTSLTAAADVAGPREALLAITEQIDTAFNGYTDRFIQDSAADDAANPIRPVTMNDVPRLPGNDVTNTPPH